MIDEFWRVETDKKKIRGTRVRFGVALHVVNNTESL